MSDKGVVVGEYQHITVFVLLISITIFLNKGTAQVQFYFMHAGLAEFRKMVYFFQIGNTPAI